MSHSNRRRHTENAHDSRRRGGDRDLHLWWFLQSKKKYGFGNLCPWAQDSFDWNGLCSHKPLLEPVVGDLHLSSEQAEAMAAETAENNRQYGLEYAKNLRANPTKDYLEGQRRNRFKQKPAMKAIHANKVANKTSIARPARSLAGTIPPSQDKTKLHATTKKL